MATTDSIFFIFSFSDADLPGFNPACVSQNGDQHGSRAGELHGCGSSGSGLVNRSAEPQLSSVLSSQSRL
jgi:hypothetical protein